MVQMARLRACKPIMKQKKMKHKEKRDSESERAVDRNFTSVSFCHSEKVMNLIRGPVWFQEYFISLKLDV